MGGIGPTPYDNVFIMQLTLVVWGRDGIKPVSPPPPQLLCIWHPVKHQLGFPQTNTDKQYMLQTQLEALCQGAQ